MFVLVIVSFFFFFCSRWRESGRMLGMGETVLARGRRYVSLRYRRASVAWLQRANTVLLGVI